MAFVIVTVCVLLYLLLIAGTQSLKPDSTRISATQTPDPVIARDPDSVADHDPKNNGI